MKTLPLLFLTVILGFTVQTAAADTAPDITPACRLTSTDAETKCTVVTDASYRTYITLRENGSVQADLPDTAAYSGLYINFRCVPAAYTVERQNADGGWEFIAAPDPTIVNMFVPVEGRGGALRVVVSRETLIAELRIIGAGELPDWVQTWRHPEGKADLMLIVAHPDDELVFLGGTLPYYCGQQHKKTVVVYMTTGWERRRNELLDGLWTCGEKDYPVLCEFPDSFSTYINYAFKLWGGRDFVYQTIAADIRRYRPDVVISQDIEKGETGHGMHLAVAEATVRAAQLAADADYDVHTPDLLGAWQIQKLYLHKYSQNRIRLPWDTMELSAFGGKTAAKVAQEAFAKHVSQQETSHRIYLSGSYDSRIFGLYFSAVGPDEAKDDFFEHIAANAD